MILLDDEKTKDDWIGSVGRAIVRCSSTYVSKGNSGTKTKESGKGGVAAFAQQSNEEYYDSDSDWTNSSNNPYFND
jgi:hypothetical protein